MTKSTGLRARYRDSPVGERPGFIDGPSWEIFIAHVRDGRALIEIARDLGLSRSKVSVVVSRVDRDLRARRPAGSEGSEITPASPIEALRLSMRARNALRELGCHSVASVLEKDFTRAVRRLGAVSRQEILSALTSRGFDPPPTLQDRQEAHVIELSRAVNKLKEHIDESYRRWCDQLERLAARVRRLSENER